WQASRYLLARDEQVVVRSGITASIIILLMMAFLHIAVTTINLINPAIVPSEMCYIWMALNKLPIWLGVVVCGGIMSAALSSCATFASLIGFSISNDILPYFVKSMRDQDEKKNIRNSRITMLIVGIVTLVITYFQPPAVMWIAYFAATLFAVSWLYMSFGSIWLKKVNERGAFYSMLFGAVSFVVCQIMVTFFGFSFPTLLRPEIIGFLFSIIGYAIFNPTSSQSKEEIEFRNSIFEKTEKFTITEIKRTLNYTKILIASGVLLILIMVIWYYYPYSVAMQ
ncbi:MAG: sodium:solute symporter family protein, partial [Clostridiaceae bacterium]|nr:sodium:solute symporter family protein [Clostridiaceae bacterium]